MPSQAKKNAKKRLKRLNARQKEVAQRKALFLRLQEEARLRAEAERAEHNRQMRGAW